MIIRPVGYLLLKTTRLGQSAGNSKWVGDKIGQLNNLGEYLDLCKDVIQGDYKFRTRLISIESKPKKIVVVVVVQVVVVVITVVDPRNIPLKFG